MKTAKAILQTRVTEGPVNLVAAVESCHKVFANAETIALLYTPAKCWLTKVTFQDGKCCFISLATETAKDTVKTFEKALDTTTTDSVFEARLFNPFAELRWLHLQNGEGRAALIADEITDITGCLSQQLSPLTAIHTLTQTYLLWGEGVDPTKSNMPDGWSRLTTSRIGRLDVPVSGVDNHKNKRVQLRVLEYLAEYDADGSVVQSDNEPDGKKLHGNVAVVEERLLSLEVAQ